MALSITTSAREIGLAPSAHYTVENLWTDTAATSSGLIGARVRGDSAVLYRVSRVSG